MERKGEVVEEERERVGDRLGKVVGGCACEFFPTGGRVCA